MRGPEAVESDEAAISLAVAHPDVRVEIFEPDWGRVDAARLRVERGGMAHRVGVHHRLALLCPLVLASLARAGVRAVIVGSR